MKKMKMKTKKEKEKMKKKEMMMTKKATMTMKKLLLPTVTSMIGKASYQSLDLLEIVTKCS